jgi:hypothetical protein
MEMNGPRQLLVYLAVDTLLGESVSTTNKNKEVLSDGSNKVVPPHRLNLMFVSRHHKAGQDHNTNTGSNFVENSEKFKYLPTQ